MQVKNKEMYAEISKTIFFLFLLFLAVEATDINNTNDTESEDRQPRVNGRIVKLYSGSRPEPIYCPHEGFLADQVDCAVFYRCVKGANNKFTVFRFQCGPGTIYDPDTEVCNFPRSTKRSNCGGYTSSAVDKNNENEIEEGVRPELPSPINMRPVYSEAIKDSTMHSIYPDATSKPIHTQSATTAFPWMTTALNKESSSIGTVPGRQEGNACTKDGFMGDNENCRKFYRCVGNQRGGFIRYEFSCSETTVWDDEAQSCNHPWAVQRSRCGRSNSGSTVTSLNINEQSSNNQASLQTTSQEQLQINYGDKVSQTQTQISHAQVKQNQTQINYGNRGDKKQNSQAKQNQTQISHGSALSQTQTQINYGNGVQTQLQVDHTKGSSQSQAQVYETTSKTTTNSNIPQDAHDSSYGMQPSNEDNENKENNENECNESGFMGDKNDCKTFYRCVDNGRGGYIKYEFSCGEGTVWDPDIEACNHAWAVKECGGKIPQNSPQSPPQTTTTTMKPIQNNEPNIDFAPSTESEDIGYGMQNQQSETTTTTIQPNLVTTSSTGESSSEGTICTSSGFKGNPNDCKVFYRCVDNGKGGYTKYEYNCGEGTVWDPEIEACNHPWAVKNCGGFATDINKIETTTTQSTTVTLSLLQTTVATSPENVDYDSGYGQKPDDSVAVSTTTKHPQDSGTDECTSSGFVGDNNDCKKFYRCVDNGNGGYTRYEFSCGEGTVWDSEKEACNHAWAVEKCGSYSSENINKETTSSARPTMSDEEVVTSDHQSSYPTQTSGVTQSSEQSTLAQKPSSETECSQAGFMEDESDCKKFYRCVDNGQGGLTKFEFSCGEGTIWDPEITACNHPNFVKRSCKVGNSNQSENVSQTPQVSSTEQVDYTETQTTTTNDKTTTSKPSAQNDCSQDGFMADRKDCKKFYRCVDNGKGGFTKYEFTCGEGTVWDSEINACNHPSSDGNCRFSETSPIVLQTSANPDRENDDMYTESSSASTSESTLEQTQTTASSHKPPTSNDTCTAEGFYGDSKNCKNFYRCVDNGNGGYIKYEFTCGEGTVWDQEIQACNHEPSDSKCSKDSQNSQHQIETSSMSTPSTTTEEQQFTQKPLTSPNELRSNCTSEGFYANLDNCRKFYRCVDNGKGGYIQYDFSCGEGTMWVQEIQSCDHDTEESCKSQSESSSSISSSQTSTTELNNNTASTQKPDMLDDESPHESPSAPTSSETSSSSEKCTAEGFYPNKNNCKKFYRCVDNGNGEYTKYDFDCGEGTAWDQNIQSCNHISEVENCQGPQQGQSQPLHDEGTSESTGTTSSGSALQASTSRPAAESSKPPSKDSCEQEGYYGNTQDCTKFYRCVDNGKGGFTKYDFTCGEGTIWDQDITTCNHPQDVTNPSCKQNGNADSSNTSSSSTTTTTNASSSSSSESSSSTTESNSSNCSQNSNKKPDNKDVNCTEAGYYPDPNDCKKFYRCVDWDGEGKHFSVYHFECGEGTIWDPALDTCNHEDSVYPPRDCSGGSQSQGETVEQEATTTESSSGTTESSTQQTSTEESSTNEQTTQQSSSQQTTTEQSTTTEEATTQPTTTQKPNATEQTAVTEENPTTQKTTTEPTTTEQVVTQESTTQESTTKETTTQESTTHETTTQESITQESTTQESTTQESTTQASTTQESTTQESSTHVSTTQESTTSSTTESDQQNTTEQSNSDGTTTEGSTTEQSTTSQTNETETTESSTSTTSEDTNSSTTESSGDQTTESSSSDKECPETEEDQNLFICPTSFKRHPKYCNMFYQCTEDDDTHDVKIATFRCPNNTIYDESKTQCVEEKKADKKCDGEIAQKRRVKRLDTTNKEPIVITDERLKCPAPGHYPFEKEECSPAFLKCQKLKSGKTRGYVYQCPQGHVYWSVSRRCEPKSHLRDCKKSHNDWSGRWEIPVERRNVAP